MENDKNKGIANIIPSILVAVLINMKLISQSLVIYTGANDGFFAVILEVSFAVFLLTKLWRLIRKRKATISAKSLIVIVYVAIISLWFLLSSHVTQSNFVGLISYVIFPSVLVAVSDLDFSTIATMSMLLSVLAIPVSSQMIILDARRSIGMDVAYAFIPSIISTIIHFFWCRKEVTKWAYLLYIAPIYYSYNLILYGVRGPIVCIVVAFILALYFSPYSPKISFKKIAFTILMGSVALFLNDVLIALKDILDRNGISWYFLNKTVSLAAAGNVLHGRDNLIKLSWDGFLKSFMWGNGMNSFMHYTGYEYPHNFILQFLFEGGLIIFGLFVVLLYSGTKSMIVNKNAKQYGLYILLFSISVPYMLMSSNPWNSPLLWIYIGYLLHNCMKEQSTSE